MTGWQQALVAVGVTVALIACMAAPTIAARHHARRRHP